MIPISGQAHRLPHMPALDGVRGLAVVAVLLFHSEFAWATGGHLGVTTFFVLSGFLITSLLLTEFELSGRIDLRAFWTRRARRLVPAALLTVGLIALYIRWFALDASSGVFGDGVASLFWVANWRFILEGTSYADMFSEPSPFRHFWSLAIEEQFYVVVPLIVAGVATVLRDARVVRWALGAIFATVVVVSTEVAALLHAPGDAPLRAYYGTDARIAEPALGALLAVLVCRSGAPLQFRRVRRWVLDAAALVALAALTFLAATLAVWNNALYDGGLLVAAALAAVVVLAATQSDGLLSRALAVEPLAVVGRMSYGIYLFHWPVFFWLSERRTGLDPPRLLMLRVTVTIAIAALSYAAVELPVRAGALPRRVGPMAWANATVVLVAALAVVSGTVTWPAPNATEVASGLGRSPTHHGAHAGGSARAAPSGPQSAARPLPAPPPGPAPTPGGPPAERSGRAARSEHQPRTAAPTTTTTSPQGLRVAFIGDSLSRNIAEGTARWGASSGMATVRDFSIDGCPIGLGGERRFDKYHPWPIEEKCEWWRDDHSEWWEALHAFDPDVIVLHDATNEITDRKQPHWVSWMRPGEPIFGTWLTGEYRALIDKVASRNTGILLLNAPCADWSRNGWFRYVDGADDRVRALNVTVYHEIATTASRVVDLYAHLCPDDRYSDDVDGVANARPDGMHLSDEAATRVAERLVGPAILEVHQERLATSPEP